MPNLSGQYLGRYHLIEQLGEGGMAVVYKAYDTRLEREVAIKVIRRDAFPPQNLADVLKRFEREAKSLARLSHPNIVKVYDFGEHESSPFLVMEYLPGGTLKKQLVKTLKWQEAVRLLLPVARGVTYAHQRGILHRDIKPANILITESGEPMLSDFGIAKIFEEGQTTALTGSGMAIGTPEYMAPEQWTGKTSPQSDLYSLGIVFYEMIAGRKPYVADTPAAILLKQATEPLPRPSQFTPDLPESVEWVLIKTLARNPEDRYVNVNGMIEAMESLLLITPALYVPPAPVNLQEKPIAEQEHPTRPILTELEMQDGGPTILPDLEPAGKPMKISERPGDRQALPEQSIPVEVAMQDGGETVYPTIMPPPAPSLPGQTAPRPSSRVSPWLLILGMSAVVTLALVVAGFSLVGKLFAAVPVTLPTQPIGEITAALVTPTLAATSALTSSNVPTPVATEPGIAETPTLAPGAVQVSPIDGMLLHYVPAGTFTMGDTAEHAFAECQKTGPPPGGCKLSDFKNEEPIHQVYQDAFWMDETEVTNAMYKLCVDAGTCKKPNTLDYYSHSQFKNYPVVFIIWNSANTYCKWAGRRLPTEAEWEKAARGADGRTYPWGEAVGKEYANYNLSVGDATNVGSYELGKSPYGLYDMAGNVNEMVADWYQSNYYSTLGQNTSNPQGPSNGDGHVIRGGGFLYNFIQSANRVSGSGGYSETGFRCAMSANPSPATPVGTNIQPSATPASSASQGLGIGSTLIREMDGMTMLYVPAGEFQMGSSDSDRYAKANEKPIKTVYLEAFWIDKTEVTNAMFAKCVQAGNCQRPFRNNSATRSNYYGNLQFDNYPVVNVDIYLQARKYCEWVGGDVPSEEQWEKAARGTDQRIYPWGDGMDCNHANFRGCVGDTKAVGSYPQGVSPYGLFDMAGNVMEWTGGFLSEGVYSLHGGSWNDSLGNLRIAARYGALTDLWNEMLGFRCVTPAQ